MQAALWTALRTLDEKTALARQLEDTARGQGHEDRAQRYSASGQETDTAARLIRARLASGGAEATKDGDPG
jgi:two-component system, chemotaxis family, protein-glutamate methylesterase/glutaminase